MRPLVRKALFAAGSLIGLAAILLVVAVGLGIAGYRLPFDATDVTRESPFAGFIGRDYRVKAEVIATAWNDYPDRARILTVSLEPPPGTRNRFVSYTVRLGPGQRVRLVSAWRRFVLVGFQRHYVVSVTGAELPEGVPVTLATGADGMPDPSLFEPIGQ